MECDRPTSTVHADLFPQDCLHATQWNDGLQLEVLQLQDDLAILGRVSQSGCRRERRPVYHKIQLRNGDGKLVIISTCALCSKGKRKEDT